MENIFNTIQQLASDWNPFAPRPGRLRFQPANVAFDFPIFSALPEELRRRIWRLALGPARVLHFRLRFDKEGTPYLWPGQSAHMFFATIVGETAVARALSATCREAREEVLLRLPNEWVFTPTEKREHEDPPRLQLPSPTEFYLMARCKLVTKPIYIRLNLARDVISLTARQGADNKHMRRFLESGKKHPESLPAILHEIQNLAIDVDGLEGSEESSLASLEHGPNPTAQFIASFHGLKRLFLIAHGLDSTPNSLDTFGQPRGEWLRGDINRSDWYCWVPSRCTWARLPYTNLEKDLREFQQVLRVGTYWNHWFERPRGSWLDVPPPEMDIDPLERPRRPTLSEEEKRRLREMEFKVMVHFRDYFYNWNGREILFQRQMMRLREEGRPESSFGIEDLRPF